MSVFLLEQMAKASAGELIEQAEFKYSSDEPSDDECENQYKIKKQPRNYADAAKTEPKKRILPKTLICEIEENFTLNEFLKAIEKENLDEYLEGVQFLRRNTAIELVMKTNEARIKLLEYGLNINNYQHAFKISNINRRPKIEGKRLNQTHVSVFGRPIEAKQFNIGSFFEEMGYGRHVYTKPVMRTTPGKGTPYYSSSRVCLYLVVLAVIEDMPKPIPTSLNIVGYKIRTRHNGQDIHNRIEKTPCDTINETYQDKTHQQSTCELEQSNSKPEENPPKTTNEENIDKLTYSKKKINNVNENKEEQTKEKQEKEEKKEATKPKNNETQLEKTKADDWKTLETRRKEYYFEKPTNKQAEEEEDEKNHTKNAEESKRAEEKNEKGREKMDDDNTWQKKRSAPPPTPHKNDRKKRMGTSKQSNTLENG
ncbi:uncharacterized protein LOC124815041 [Hydra vulgaris]|uniref:uncharacterized protein LOC124815041 n=1 Tax=Hydra vulgaris TaxID=6087 RepID=UPI001F5FAEC8|nr:uncharacterized protein LOC124815041 [Hydra vulgaris]